MLIKKFHRAVKLQYLNDVEAGLAQGCSLEQRHEKANAIELAVGTFLHKRWGAYSSLNALAVLVRLRDTRAMAGFSKANQNAFFINLTQGDLRRQNLDPIIPVLVELIGQGARVNGTNTKGETALALAIHKEAIAWATALVDLGADPLVPDHDQNTPMSRLADALSTSQNTAALALMERFERMARQRALEVVPTPISVRRRSRP